MVKLTYSEALAYIHSVSWKGSVPGLSRITELCGKMGNPQEKLRFIHVTGTNGKGSSCAMLESILRNAGYKTGLFTSPFVKHFNERMAVCGKSISDEQLAEITGEVKVYADSMTESPTEFELITAIAFRYFEKEKCDIVILEVGMGGRLDSTNVVHNTAVSLITGVALDHTEYLGDTVEKIAAEKAGIIKPGRPVVCGLREENSGAARVIREKAEALGSEFIQVDYGKLKITKADLSGAEFSYGEFKEMRISLLGLYQPENAAKVLETVKVLRKLGYGLSEEAVRKGLSDTVWHARFEKLSENPRQPPRHHHVHRQSAYGDRVSCKCGSRKKSPAVQARLPVLRRNRRVLRRGGVRERAGAGVRAACDFGKSRSAARRVRRYVHPGKTRRWIRIRSKFHAHRNSQRRRRDRAQGLSGQRPALRHPQK